MPYAYLFPLHYPIINVIQERELYLMSKRETVLLVGIPSVA